MSRRALLLSLALHTAVLVVVGKWLTSSAGPGNPGAGATFSAAPGGGLLVEIAPPSALDPTLAALPVPPDFTPLAPTIELPAAPLEVLTSQTSPLPALPAHAPQAAAAKTAAAAATKSGRATRAGGSSASSASGSGLASAGFGGGGSGYVPPSFRLRYKPSYPAEARAQRLEGTVLLLVSLDARGRVTAASLQRTCGHGILDRAALASVRSWLFEPARQNGTAIAAQVEIPIRFRFEEHAATRA